MGFWILAAILTAPLLAGSSGAADRRLEAYTADLAKNPQDRDLRERIIRLALTLRPRPSLPEQAAELKGYAAAALGGGQTPPDYAAAAQAYEKALAMAPWCAPCYFGQGAALEGMGRSRDAEDAFRFYLMASPDAKDAQEVRERIGALKYRAEKAAAGQALQEQASDVLTRFRRSASGAYASVFECGHESPARSLHKRRRMDCDQAEYAGDHWYKLEASATHEFRFPDNGTIELWTIHGIFKHRELVGRPKGQALGDIQWMACEEIDECSKPTWVRFSDDLDTITISLDRPPGDQSPDPNKRYAYIRYCRK